jgi:O-antigen ligase
MSGHPVLGWADTVLDLLAPAYAFAAPVLYLNGTAPFLPSLVDAYVLPRVALAVLFGGILFAAGLWAVGRGRAWLGLGRSMALAVTLVAAAVALAWLFSINPALSFAGAYSRYESVVVRLAYLGLFCGGFWLARGRSARWTTNAFVVACSTASVEAFFQWATHAPFRPDGNLGQAGLLGALLAMAIPLALQAGLRYSPWLLTLPVLCAGLLVSTSRAGWLAVVVAVFVFAAFAARLPSRRRLLLALGILGAAAAVLLLVASPLRTLNSDTGAARLGVWSDAIRAADARPLTGWGEDTTGLVFGRFQSADWEPGDTFDRIHDQPLDLLITQGVLGSLGALAMWGLLWVAAWRRAESAPLPRDAAALLGAVAGYECWSLLNFDWAPATGPLYVLAGIAWLGVVERGRVGAGVEAEAGTGAGVEEPLPSGSIRAWGAAIAAALAVSAGAVVGVTPVVADALHFRGANADAVRLDPLQAAYHQALGEQLGKSGPGALAELRRAFELGDYDYGFCVELGDAALATGDRALARAAYTRANDVYRFDPTARDKLRAMGAG